MYLFHKDNSIRPQGSFVFFLTTDPEFQSKRLVKTNFSQENEPVLEHARNVDVLDQALRIKHTGLYYVYSSVHFRPDSVYPCKSFTYKVNLAFFIHI